MIPNSSEDVLGRHSLLTLIFNQSKNRKKTLVFAAVVTTAMGAECAKYCTLCYPSLSVVPVGEDVEVVGVVRPVA